MKIYKVIWLDPMRINDEELTKPFSKHLATTESIGYVEKDGKNVAVIYSENDVSDEKDFIIIPKSLIVKMVEYE